MQIDSWSDNGVDKAFDVHGFMKRVGVRPAATTYTALIDCCARARALERAMAVLQEMLHIGEQPDVNCFNMVIHICGEVGKTRVITRLRGVVVLGH